MTPRHISRVWDDIIRQGRITETAVNGDDWLADHIEENRPRLRRIAYRMLGSVSEADDAVQDTWLRLSRADAGVIENLGGWLTTAVGRACLDLLRARGTRREEPFATLPPRTIATWEDTFEPDDECPWPIRSVPPCLWSLTR